MKGYKAFFCTLRAWHGVYRLLGLRTSASDPKVYSRYPLSCIPSLPVHIHFLDVLEDRHLKSELGGGGGGGNLVREGCWFTSINAKPLSRTCWWIQASALLRPFKVIELTIMQLHAGGGGGSAGNSCCRAEHSFWSIFSELWLDDMKLINACGWCPRNNFSGKLRN
ncbi:uncharacterized protein BDR25DRAFT_350174 [Lindgomyces ingoldianus]|uniref:Uncharacterized protein n=1 Tax=Lindgomyces ingoldianus TaxID=673940 RepID=A0ACB6RAW0_9PLEO|nr:uncharacterized protein BDR25DRAFT_350174 [Lindgomyces ingoldianus]KAF2475898.1 hypothetical protein BDR25DRAFT_350174 [Lindgomyces ingoldianus]